MLKSGFVLIDRHSNKPIDGKSNKIKKKLTLVLAEKKAKRKQEQKNIDLSDISP